MFKKTVSIWVLLFTVLMLCACGKKAEATSSFPLDDGTYVVDFTTDSSMFRVNEVMDGKAVMMVENNQANVYIVLTSKNIVNLYKGFAEDAKTDEQNWLQPQSEEVTYSDGLSDEVNAFNVPVDVIDQEFDLALLGKKGVWYDHKVSVSNPVKAEGQSVELTLEGGTGKVTLTSPTNVVKTASGYDVTLIWSSKNYDYMIVDGVKYLPDNVGESSSEFTIPVKTLEEPLDVIADTVAMSTPHEIEYTITFLTDTIK